jgi:hypothetical protein
MFEFIHDIIEAWIQESASKGLHGLRRALMERHLRSCQRCRSFALDLIEFTHNLDSPGPGPKLSGEDKEEIHSRVMAAFHRELLEERVAPAFERAAGPLIRPNFVKALSMAAFIVAAVFVLSYPYRHSSLGGADGGEANLNSSLNASLASPPAPEPSSTVTPIAPLPAK